MVNLKKDIFVTPNIRIFDGLEDFQKLKEEYRISLLPDEFQKINLKSLLDHRLSLVVGEPGSGKTYLLREIVKLITLRASKEAIFVELKSFAGGDTIPKIINRQLALPDAIRTKKFKLKNLNSIVICLDGLDEIRQDIFSEAIEKIKDFLNEYKNISLLLSCRLNYYQKFPVFEGKKFKIVMLYPFSLKDTQEYLEKSKIPKEKIELIFKKLRFQNRQLIIQIPRYLSLLIEYIHSNPVADISQINRGELFEYFIYKKLEKEDRVLDRQKRDIIKRVLEKLALIMEIYQANEIDKDELMTFFDNAKSNLIPSLLAQTTIEAFYDKSLIKDNIQTISFENPEFQEYLASKELLRMGRLEKTLYDIVVDKELQEIHPSWFNTLSFLLEQKPDLLDKILRFGFKKTKLVIDDEYSKLLLKLNYEKVNKETRITIFKEILTHYQVREELWLDWDIAEGLSYFYDNTLSDFLKSWVDTRENGQRLFVKEGNMALIVHFLLKNKSLAVDDQQYWKKKLIRFANSENENGVLQRLSLYALSEFKDPLLIKKVENTWRHKDELVQRAFLRFCYRIDPNCEPSIKYFVEGTKRDFLEARYGIWEINNKEGIKRLLNSLKNDTLFLQHFLDKESIFREKDEKINQNIKVVLDEEIAKLAFDILIKAFESKYSYYVERSNFIERLTLLLKEYDSNFLFNLISRIKSSDELKTSIFSFQNVFAAVLEKNQVERFINELSETQRSKRLALWTLQQIKFSNRKLKEEIYEEGRKYLRREYEESEKFARKERLQQSESKEETVYKEFQLRLEPGKGKYDPGIFRFYIDNKEILEKKITEIERKRIINLMTRSIFEKFDPKDGYKIFKINRRDSNNTSFTWHSWNPIFADCIKLASLLKIDISKYRQKIINFIPFAYYEERKAIFKLIKNVKTEELKYVLAIYKSNSDLRLFQPESFIEFVKEYELEETLRIIEEFVKEETLSVYNRIESLKLMESLKPDKKLLEKIFKEYKKRKDESFQLSETANQLLIENYKDEKAISWRFTQLKKRIFEFEEPIGVHSVGPQENELHEKRFANSLMELKDMSYIKKFLDLIDFSFKKINKNERYWNYVQYLWRIVFKYFDGLKYTRSYEAIKQLENFLQNNIHSDYSNWFKGELKQLKRSYLVYIGRPSNINSAIKSFNETKSRQYLSIGTPEELFDNVKKIINEDLKNWIENEGGSKIIRNKKEPEIQPNIQLALENKFLKRGLDFQIYREPQKLDSKRVDFLINYGFIGQILLELKLSSHPDLKGNNLENKGSFKSLQRYMKGFSVDYGILLVINNARVDNNKLNKIKNSYSKIKGLDTIGLNFY